MIEKKLNDKIEDTVAGTMVQEALYETPEDIKQPTQEQQLVEGFFGLLKRERTRYQKYRTRAEIRADVFSYIERFHNPRMQRRVARADQQFTSFLNRP